MKQVFTKYIGKQQYLYIALAIIGMCLAGASIVLAQEPTTDDVRSVQARPAAMDIEARQNAIDQKRAQFEALRMERMKEIETKRTEMKLRAEERRAALSVQAQQRITALGSSIANRLESAIATMQGIVTRFESRIATLQERGVNVDEAATLVAEAKQLLSEAKLLLDGIDTDVEYVITSDTPRADWTETKETLREIHALIKDARELLRQAIASLKEAVSRPDADTTADDSPTTDN